MLSRVRILQIGDIHLTTSASTTPFIDIKDPNFPARLADIISVSPLKRVFRRLSELLELGNVDGVLFMGDLTDYGKLNGYEACCQYIADTLELGPGGRFATVPIGIVPGNHDVDRKLAKEPSAVAKFTPLSNVLAKVGIQGLPVTDPSVLEFGSGGPKAAVFLLNSCWGCGDEMHIPEEFRAPIALAIDNAIAGAAGDRTIKAYYDRQLDSPAFAEDTITKVVQLVREMPGERLPIVVAHHNLLPQRLPRLAPYTELVNGAALRGSLSDIARPILYLHGHIHTDPIEIIQTPSGSPMVCVSAPAAVAGFNVIEIIYSPQNVPIACHVTPYRFDESGILVEKTVVPVTLTDKRRRRGDPQLGQLLGKLLEKGRVYWNEIESIGNSLSGSPSGADLEGLLEQLFADGLIEIDNRHLQVASWIVRAEI